MKCCLVSRECKMTEIAFLNNEIEGPLLTYDQMSDNDSLSCTNSLVTIMVVINHRNIPRGPRCLQQSASSRFERAALSDVRTSELTCSRYRMSEHFYCGQSIRGSGQSAIQQKPISLGCPNICTANGPPLGCGQSAG